MPSFAEFALARMPELARRLGHKDVTDWLAGQERLEIDGETRWLIWGDRMADEAEMKLEWARECGLVDPAELARLQDEYGLQNSDVEAVEIAPLPNTKEENDDG